MLGIPELCSYSFANILVVILKTSILREMCKNYVHEVLGEDKDSFMV